MGATAVVLAVPSIAVGAAHADQLSLAADSAAHGHGLFVDGIGLDILGAAYAQSQYPGDVGPNDDVLNVALLGSLLELELGTIEIPLITPTVGGDGLLYLGDLGTMSSRAESPSSTNSTASSGIINEDGSLNVDTADGEGFESAELNVTQLLGQVLDSDVIDDLLDEASLKIGALGSTAEKNGLTLTSEYAVADLQLDIGSPLVSDLTTIVADELTTILGPLQDLLGPTGDIGELVSDLVDAIAALGLGLLVNAELNELSIDIAPLLQEVTDELLLAPIENTEGTISIDLANGTINVDLKQIIMDRFATTDLNSLDPNTEVLDGTTINLILDGVTDALTGAGPNSLLSKVVDIVTEGLYDVELTVDVQVEVLLGLGDAPVIVSGTLGGFLGDDDHDEPVVDVSQLELLGVDVGTVLQPIINLLTGLVTDIGGVLEPVVEGVLDDLQPALMAALSPLVTALVDDALQPLLSEVLQIRINEQPTEAPLNTVGDLGAGSFTVRALAVRLLPLIAPGDVSIELGSSTVMALDEDDADADATDADATDADATDADATDADATDADATDADATDADATDADATDADATDADATDADATDADATDADATDADATDADATDADATDADATDADATDADATDADATDADATDADATDADATDADATDADATDADATDADATDADATDADATDADGGLVRTGLDSLPATGLLAMVLVALGVTAIAVRRVRKLN